MYKALIYQKIFCFECSLSYYGAEISSDGLILNLTDTSFAYLFLLLSLYLRNERKETENKVVDVVHYL